MAILSWPLAFESTPIAMLLEPAALLDPPIATLFPEDAAALTPSANAPFAKACALKPKAVEPMAVAADPLPMALEFVPEALAPWPKAELFVSVAFDWRPTDTEFCPVDVAASPIATPKFDEVAPLPAPIEIEYVSHVAGSFAPAPWADVALISSRWIQVPANAVEGMPSDKSDADTATASPVVLNPRAPMPRRPDWAVAAKAEVKCVAIVFMIPLCFQKPSGAPRKRAYNVMPSTFR